MAITEVVRLDIQTQQAQANMEGLSATINEQKLITIELERELKRLEQALRDTPKTAMAAQRDLNQQINHVKDSISDQRLSLKELQVQQSQTQGISKYTDKQKGLGDAMKITSQETTGLNMVSGGYASQLRNIQLLLGFAQKKALLFAGSLNVIKVALISTGIGVLVVALGLIVAYWDEIKTAVTGVSDEMREQVRLSEEQVEAAKNHIDEINRTENSLKLQGKTEEQILQLKVAAVKVEIEKKIEQRKTAKELADAQIKAEKRNKKLLENAVSFISIPLTLVLKSIDAINKFRGKPSDFFGDFQDFVSGLIFDPDKTQEEADEADRIFKEQIESLQNQADGYTITLQGINRKRTDDALAEEKRRIDEIRALREKELEMQRSVQEQVDALANEYFEKFLSDQEREENAIEEKYFNLIEMAKQYGIDTAEIEEARLFELESIQKNYDAEREIAEQERIDAEKSMAKDLQDFKINMAQQALSVLISAVGEQSAIGKAAAVASATIDTYQSAVSAYAAGLKVGGPAGLVIAPIAAGLAVAAGLANIKKILSTKTPGGGGGGGSVPSATRPPSFNMIGDRGGVSDVQSGIDNGEQAPPKAYVVGGDVTTQQELDRNAVNASGF